MNVLNNSMIRWVISLKAKKVFVNNVINDGIFAKPIKPIKHDFTLIYNKWDKTENGW